MKPIAPVAAIIPSGSKMERWSSQSIAIAVTISVGTQMMSPPKVGVPAFDWWDAGWSSLIALPARCARRYWTIGQPSPIVSAKLMPPERSARIMYVPPAWESAPRTPARVTP